MFEFFFLIFFFSCYSFFLSSFKLNWNSNFILLLYAFCTCNLLGFFSFFPYLLTDFLSFFLSMHVFRIVYLKIIIGKCCSHYSNNATQSNIHLYFSFLRVFPPFFVLPPFIHALTPFKSHTHLFTHTVSLVTEEILNNFLSLSFCPLSLRFSIALPFLLCVVQSQEVKRQYSKSVDSMLLIYKYIQILSEKLKIQIFHGKIKLNAYRQYDVFQMYLLKFFLFEKSTLPYLKVTRMVLSKKMISNKLLFASQQHFLRIAIFIRSF